MRCMKFSRDLLVVNLYGFGTAITQMKSVDFIGCCHSCDKFLILDRYMLSNCQNGNMQKTILFVRILDGEKYLLENAPLRIYLNGKLQSAPEDIYDSFFLRELNAQTDGFLEAEVIGNILEKYQLGIGDM